MFRCLSRRLPRFAVARLFRQRHAAVREYDVAYASSSFILPLPLFTPPALRAYADVTHLRIIAIVADAFSPIR